MSAENDPNGILLGKVFNNRIIVRNILEHGWFDPFEHLRYRLVNKTFNGVCLEIVRRKYKEVEIKYIGKQFFDKLEPESSEDDERERDWIRTRKVFINWTAMKLTDVRKFLRFLTEVCCVQTETIVLRYLWKLNTVYQKFIHDSLYSTLIQSEKNSMNTLIGMSDICSGCSKCYYMATICEIHGPYLPYSTSYIKEVCHYKTLIITDLLLDQFAYSIFLTSSGDGLSLEYLHNRISDTFTCEKLILMITEAEFNNIELQEENEGEHDSDDDSDVEEDDDEEQAVQQCLPLEVLQFILNKWKVKNIEIQYICGQIHTLAKTRWLNSGLFVCLRPGSPYKADKNPIMDHVFDSVSVNLFESRQWDRLNESGKSSLINDVRRVFPVRTLQ